MTPLRARVGNSRALIAGTGRVVVVWLAAGMVAAAHEPLGYAGLIATCVVTGIWLVALRAAQASAPFVLGPWVPAAIGSTTGVVAVAATMRPAWTDSFSTAQRGR